MDTTPWRDLLKIGIAEIDTEHLLIMQLVESLRDTLRNARRDSVPDEFARSTLRKLLAYTRQHFATEETLMNNSGYPEFANHKREHDLFLQHLEAAEEHVFSGDVAAIAALLSSLSNWLHHHVEEIDKYLGVYLLEKSVASRHPLTGSTQPPPEPEGEA